MDRLDELEKELDNTYSELENATPEDEDWLKKEMDRIMCELGTYDDNWVPETTDVDTNEL